jgi:hypothetical protein
MFIPVFQIDLFDLPEKRFALPTRRIVPEVLAPAVQLRFQGIQRN